MQGFLGIDWGTHSSKWVYQTRSGSPIIGEIWDSGVSKIDDCLAWFRLDERVGDANREIGLKRKLIQDPDQSFWEGTRPKIGVTLGESTVFSILALLHDAECVVSRRGQSLRSTELTVRFSHPNWIEESNIAALRCFRDAAVLALKIFLDSAPETGDGLRFPIARLRSAVEHERKQSPSLAEFPKKYVHSQFERCLKGKLRSAEWELIFESCAAGFPYLIEGERDIFEDEITKLNVNRRIRKILVVDVGAGSTDVGYLVRTVRPPDARKVMRPLLIWLPAANALEIAGRWLTDKILADLKHQGRPVTLFEAEQLKIHQGSWVDKPYVKEWYGLISDHVGDYAWSIRDEVCLPRQPALEVVITGGSSAVEPMRSAVTQRVTQFLRNRGIATGVHSLHSAALRSIAPGYREVQIAQLAVALGASDPNLSQLKAYPEGML